ncbi:hypothetical protein V5O48_000843 [Marasmius crinis-equi]|uniref:GSKIP domain-containing protein n=1 Tax=Marasmius crinis-equi TaxID=585013 RepID=A0ABR3G002_9AGAR
MSYPSFYADELQAALREQGAAIKSFSLLKSTDSDAEGSVTLLEERLVHVILSERGYAEKPNRPDGKTQRFDTLDGLLRSLSPLYEKEQHRQLISALDKLAEERREDDGHAA